MDQKKRNPYTLVFGKEPPLLISRMAQTELILETFLGEPASQQLFMITGVRGSGKTVFMTELAKRFREEDNWIVVDLNPDRDLLTALASKLSSENSLARIFQRAKINLSFFGFGLEVSGAAPITDIETALSHMLESLQKQNKKILITIDEVVSTPEIREFTSAFQIFLRQDLPVYLLMTGLYENIHKLQNEKTLTFLYRAPKIELTPLNLGAIADNYARTLSVDLERARKMAKLTRGYPFAFQVLGYFAWEKSDDWENVIRDFRQYLDEYVYEKIWSELSVTDRKVVYALAKTPDGKISAIREILNYDTNQFNPYRRRLIRKGIITGDDRGYIYFTLPLFEYFVLDNYAD